MVSAPTVSAQIGNHDIDLLEEWANFFFAALFRESDENPGIPESEQYHITKRQSRSREFSQVTAKRLEIERGLADDSPESARLVLPPKIGQLLAFLQLDQIWQRRSRFL